MTTSFAIKTISCRGKNLAYEAPSGNSKLRNGYRKVPTQYFPPTQNQFVKPRVRLIVASFVLLAQLYIACHHTKAGNFNW